jgi:hypothetical protein
MAVSMRKRLTGLLRPVAGVLTLVFAVVSSAECATGATMTEEEKACCAAMHGDCEMAIAATCCTGEVQDDQSLVATKADVVLVPAQPLLAVLDTPPVILRSLPRHLVPTERSSTGPPGVPTYLFVSSFRI